MQRERRRVKEKYTEREIVTQVLRVNTKRSEEEGSWGYGRYYKCWGTISEGGVRAATEVTEAKRGKLDDKFSILFIRTPFYPQ